MSSAWDAVVSGVSPTTWRAMASPTIWEATRLARSSGRSRPTREARGRSNRWATSSFVALEGILLGSALGLVTAYLLFQNDPSFDNAGRGFPVPWVSIAVLVAATALASLAATAWPSRKASRIRPAVALRIAD